MTYSQADMDKFGRQEDFASGVVESFSQGRAKVKHWSCCLKEHKDGGLHFHLAIKLDQNERWISLKKYLLDVYAISIHYQIGIISIIVCGSMLPSPPHCCEGFTGQRAWKVQEYYVNRSSKLRENIFIEPTDNYL